LLSGRFQLVEVIPFELFHIAKELRLRIAGIFRNVFQRFGRWLRRRN
jgi:hypothetical protein